MIPGELRGLQGMCDTVKHSITSQLEWTKKGSQPVQLAPLPARPFWNLPHLQELIWTGFRASSPVKTHSHQCLSPLHAPHQSLLCEAQISSHGLGTSVGFRMCVWWSFPLIPGFIPKHTGSASPQTPVPHSPWKPHPEIGRRWRHPRPRRDLPLTVPYPPPQFFSSC